MCVAQTARRRRRQMKLDPRYGGWRRSIAARERKAAKQRAKQRERDMRRKK